MQIQRSQRRSNWYDDQGQALRVIDQTRLPLEFRIGKLNDLAAVCSAITNMQVRGALPIGVTAAYWLALALREYPSPESQRLRR